MAWLPHGITIKKSFTAAITMSAEDWALLRSIDDSDQMTIDECVEMLNLQLQFELNKDNDLDRTYRAMLNLMKTMNCYGTASSGCHDRLIEIMQTIRIKAE